MRPSDFEYANWSRDGYCLYGVTTWVANPARVSRLDQRTGRVDRVASLEPGRFVRYFGARMGLTPDDSPMVLRDTRAEDLYALESEAP